MFELKQVSQLATVLMGQSPPSSSCTEDGQGLPFIQGNAEFGSRNPIPLLRCSTPTRIAEKGDFLLSVRAPVGELNQSVQRMVIGRGLSAIRFPEIDQPFAWHSLKSAVGGLTRVAQGSTFVAVSRQDLENLEIHWFAVPEYRNNVAYVLDIIDHAIAKTEAVIAKLKHVRAGMLHDLLSYGLDEHGQLRDPIAHPEQFKDSDFGRIPREWEEVQMLEIAEIRFSNVNKVSMPGEEPVRLCNYTDVYNNDYVNADMDFMRATATRSEIERFGLQVGDVIMTKDSETPDDIGIPTVVETTAPDLVCGYHLALIRPNLGLVNPTFLAKQLEHHRMSRYFAQQANGTTRYGLSTAAIADVPLHLPRIEEQESIAKLIDEADAQVDASKKEVAKLRNLKSGLMSDLLTGQVRVPDSIAGGTEGL